MNHSMRESHRKLTKCVSDVSRMETALLSLEDTLQRIEDRSYHGSDIRGDGRSDIAMGMSSYSSSSSNQSMMFQGMEDIQKLHTVKSHIDQCKLILVRDGYNESSSLLSI